MKYLFTLLITLFSYSMISAQAVEAVTGINYYGGNGFDPQEITVCNGSLFFFGPSTDSFFNNLYVSDGTMSGTTFVKRINNDQYMSMSGLTALNNKLIFAETHNDGGKLWSSDGTASGTVPYTAVLTARFSPDTRMPAKFIEMSNKLYFAGADTTGQTVSNMKDQLWVTDGTATGTLLVKNINATGASGIENMYVYNGNLYFTADDGVNGRQLWISDGTASGTMILKKIYTSSTNINSYVSFNNKLYFSAWDSVANDYQMCVTDGTDAGTSIVTSFANFSFNNPIIYNSKIYFKGGDANGYAQLWSSDGTAAGTSIVHAEAPSPSDYYGFAPFNLTVLNNTLYMLASDSAHSIQLWSSDGTSGGTHIVTHSVYGFEFSRVYPSNLTTLGSKLVFIGWDSTAGNADVYVSDGTETGTASYQLPGEYNTDFGYTYFVPFNNALYYNASYFTTLDYQVDRVVLSTLGINEDRAANALMLYPNPANNYLQIKNDVHLSSIQISDVSGRVIESWRTFTGSRISIAGLSLGIYIIQATDEAGKTYTGKFVKE